MGDDVKALPEMLFSSSRVTLLHEASGVALDFTALDALRAWKQEGLPPLQVKVAQVGPSGDGGGGQLATCAARTPAHCLAALLHRSRGRSR